MLRVSVFGRIHVTRDWTGGLQMFFIFFYWLYNTQVVMWFVLLPSYAVDRFWPMYAFPYLLVAVNCLLCLAKTSTLHPGRVPVLAKTKGTDDWTYCQKCSLWRPPRAHHCRRCQHCVNRMDHHCPWVNNCIGKDNNYAFMQLLGYALLLSILSLVLSILEYYVYRLCDCYDCDAFPALDWIASWLLISVVVMSVQMIMFMGPMFFFQHFKFMTDRTTLQNMREKPGARAQFVDKRCMEVYGEYFGPGPWWRWLCPCHKRARSVSDLGATFIDDIV